MANNQRGQRGQGRGKGAGFAQSGGKATTFGGGKGGAAGASTSGRVRGANRNATGAPYVVRGDAGDNALTGLSGRAAHASGTAMGNGASKPVTVNYRKPARGGSN